MKNDFLPKNKFARKSIKLINNMESSEVLPLLEDLLPWISDLNWPVAEELFHFLPKFHNHLTSYLSSILKGHDSIWKNSVLQLLIQFPKNSTLNLYEEINKLIENPP